MFITDYTQSYTVQNIFSKFWLFTCSISLITLFRVSFLSRPFNFYLYNTCYPTKNCRQNCFTAHFYNNIWLGADKLGLLGAIKCFLIGLPWHHNLHVIKTSKSKTQWIEERQCKVTFCSIWKEFQKRKFQPISFLWIWLISVLYLMTHSPMQTDLIINMFPFYHTLKGKWLFFTINIRYEKRVKYH